MRESDTEICWEFKQIWPHVTSEEVIAGLHLLNEKQLAKFIEGIRELMEPYLYENIATQPRVCEEIEKVWDTAIELHIALYEQNRRYRENRIIADLNRPFC